MDALRLDTINMLANEYKKSYKGLAFDGEFFYLTSPRENNIHKFNRDFTPSNCRCMNKPYASMVYDIAEDCFWAADNDAPSVIFKLNKDLEEIGRLSCSIIGKNCSKITGLSCDEKKNTLYVAFTDFIAELSKDGRLIRIVQENIDPCDGIASLASYYFTVGAGESGQHFHIFTRDGRLIKTFYFPDEYNIQAIVFDSASKPKDGAINFIILALDHDDRPCILSCKIDLCGLNQETESQDSCPEHSQDNCRRPKADSCCNPKNGNCGCQKNKPCCPPCEDEHINDNCKNDLIESIALVETALAHILNAEGEKLQKAVKTASSICELLKINQAVNRTIINITQLEHILYAKLTAVNELRPKDCEEENETASINGSEEELPFWEK